MNKNKDSIWKSGNSWKWKDPVGNIKCYSTKARAQYAKANWVPRVRVLINEGVLKAGTQFKMSGNNTSIIFEFLGPRPGTCGVQVKFLGCLDNRALDKRSRIYDSGTAMVQDILTPQATFNFEKAFIRNQTTGDFDRKFQDLREQYISLKREELVDQVIKNENTQMDFDLEPEVVTPPSAPATVTSEGVSCEPLAIRALKVTQVFADLLEDKTLCKRTYCHLMKEFYEQQLYEEKQEKA
jgi:hypothetical protein